MIRSKCCGLDCINNKRVNRHFVGHNELHIDLTVHIRPPLAIFYRGSACFSAFANGSSLKMSGTQDHLHYAQYVAITSRNVIVTSTVPCRTCRVVQRPHPREQLFCTPLPIARLLKDRVPWARGIAGSGQRGQSGRDWISGTTRGRWSSVSPNEHIEDKDHGQHALQPVM